MIYSGCIASSYNESRWENKKNKFQRGSFYFTGEFSIIKISYTQFVHDVWKVKARRYTLLLLFLRKLRSNYRNTNFSHHFPFISVLQLKTLYYFLRGCFSQLKKPILNTERYKEKIQEKIALFMLNSWNLSYWCFQNCMHPIKHIFLYLKRIMFKMPSKTLILLNFFLLFFYFKNHKL